MRAAAAAATPRAGSGAWWAEYFQRVGAATGLSHLVLEVWTIAEGSNPHNPLNIIDPATRRPYSYPTPAAAAAATTQRLRKPQYAGILRAAKSGQPKAELDAITASPWDSCHYRGTHSDGTCANAKPGSLLYGVWTQLTGGPPLAGSTHSVAADPSSPLGKAGTAVVAGGGHDPQGNVTESASLTGWIPGVEAWLSAALLRGSLYVLLTFAALVLIILALVRSAGVSPRGFLASTAISPERLRQADRSITENTIPY